MTFLHDVETYLSQLSIQYYNVSHWIIGDDFNLDLFAKSNFADSFINILKCYSMFPTILQSTHLPSGTLIDNVRAYIMARYNVSYHVPTITKVKQDNAITTCSNVVFSRLFNKTNLKASRESLIGCNWDHVHNIKTVDEALAAFNGTLLSNLK